MAVDFSTVARGLPSVLAMCARIRGKIEDGKRDFHGLGQWVDGIVRAAPEKDELAELGAILGAVKGAIRYTGDPVGVDTVRSARIKGDPVASTLDRRLGDCDDMAAVAGAAAEYVGYPVRIAVQGPIPGDWKHVLVEARTRAGDWIAMDATEKDRPLGWRADLPTGVYEEERGMISQVGGWFQDTVQDVFKTGAEFGTEYLEDKYLPNNGELFTPITMAPTVRPAPAVISKPASGISTGTIAVVGALGLGALLLLKSKKRR